MPELTNDKQIAAALDGVRTIAVLGASAKPDRPAFYVPDYLAAQGFRVIGVNPQYAGTALWGNPVVAKLADLGEPADLIDVFRRPADLPAHEAEILAMHPRPHVVWLQLGIRHPGLAAALTAAGIDVVMDRCLMVEHRHLKRAAARST